MAIYTSTNPERPKLPHKFDYEILKCWALAFISFLK